MRPAFLAPALILSALPAIAQEKPAPKIMVGHLFATSPLGMAMVVNDRAALMIEPQFSHRPKNNAEVPSGFTAPDGSFLKHADRGGFPQAIAIEALCDVDEDLNPDPFEDNGITGNLNLRNIPCGGSLYRFEAKGGKTISTLGPTRRSDRDTPPAHFNR